MGGHTSAATGSQQGEVKGASFLPDLTSEVIRQRIFYDFFAGFLKGLLPNSTRSNKAVKGLPFLRSAASQVGS